MKKARVQEKRLAELEAEFEPLLFLCLRQCARARWGLFGQNDYADPEGRYWGWPEAKRTKELAKEIQDIRQLSGSTNGTCERFLSLCSLRGSNVPGEPKLAAAFLAELEQS